MFQGTRTGVPLTVYPWYLLCSRMGFLGIITQKYPRTIGLIGISHDGGPHWDRGTSLPIPWVQGEMLHNLPNFRGIPWLLEILLAQGLPNTCRILPVLCPVVGSWKVGRDKHRWWNNMNLNAFSELGYLLPFLPQLWKSEMGPFQYLFPFI